MTAIVPVAPHRRGACKEPLKNQSEASGTRREQTTLAGLQRFRSTLLLFAALSAGCMPLQNMDVPVVDMTQQPAVVSNTPSSQAYQLLSQAEFSTTPERERLILEAATLYISANDSGRAQLALQEIEPAVLPAALYSRYALLQAPLDAARRDHDAVLLRLDDSRLHVQQLNAADRAEYYQLRAEAYEGKGRLTDALNERINQSLQTPQTIEQQPISNAIWQLLNQNNSEIAFLNHAEFGASVAEQMLAGWVSLLQQAQAGELNQWRQRWPLHPANRFPPQGLDTAAIVAGSPQATGGRVALLVPVSGKLGQEGKRVRDGFLSTHYQHLARGENATQINVIDSAEFGAAAAYRQAVAQGAEVIIGPLAREAVAEVAALPESRNVTTLALNQTIGLEAATRFYQFALNPEDDARQLVDFVRSRHAGTALVLAPAGHRGERLLQATAAAWQSSALEAPKTLRYNADSGNYGVLLAQALGVELATGQLRAGHSLPQAIIFIGSANDAMQIKEALVGIGASALPLYLSSQTVGNKRQPQFDQLDGAYVCVAPWQIGRGPLADSGDNGPQATDLLYAMGSDARELYETLPRHGLAGNIHVAGNTGFLSVDEHRRIQRRLSCGQISGAQLLAAY